ncbi:alpha-L-glutamate ligase [Paenalkalicoccus suaedae]|uniref:Alpha-L-glutamate ligase n=1 Tax=Paenalkalicoccus suaedae TaxID=2592382 RepID=A0A859FIH5_9BACI|nr:alpha-L-glutamate ligase [Paenalkalicoccus suaedae]QKS72869.1 alpha-L-glutamate ligase [Paenalkalicoccus suaedae]
MSKLYIIHENDEWTAPLKAALEEQGVPHEDWHLDRGVVPLDEAPPEGVFYNRMSASSHSRGHRYAPELTAATIEWLESNNRRVLNGTRALQLEVSKVAQYQALKQFDIKVPRTIAAVGEEELLAAAEKMPTPFITKHNRAGKGLGVHRFDSVDALKRALDQKEIEPSVDGIMLLQEYIAAPDQTITRCEFIGGKFMYAVRVDTSEGFELCPADACQISDQFCPTDGSTPKAKFEIISDFTSPMIKKYENFLQANNIAFAGIEHITDANGVSFTYDVNTNTNYNPQAEEQAQLFGMKQLAAELKQELLQPQSLR